MLFRPGGNLYDYFPAMGRGGEGVMTSGSRFSDELLNAYVDNELDAEERQRIEHAMRSDERLRERIEELRSLKRLVRSAYVDDTPVQTPGAALSVRSAAGLAASVAAFALGVAVTWGWFHYTGSTTGPGVASVSGQDEVVARQEERVVKVVFHVSRSDPSLLHEILNEAEALLNTTAREERTASVRVIASGAGLSLFEKGSSPVSGRISEMKRTHQNHLIFNGCGVAYKQLKAQRADGELELLPEIQLVDLGVLELMRRQRQGWAYIRL